jgi:hypothetical protein
LRLPESVIDGGWRRGAQADAELRYYSLWVVWNQASASKASYDLPLRNSSVKSSFEARQELKFSDVVDLAADQVLGLAAITNLQRRKTAYIKRLKQMRRVTRHAESSNLVLLAVLLEFERVVAIVAVNNEQPVPANIAPLCMLIKVL